MSLEVLLAVSAVKGADEDTFEDTRIHEDIGVFKYFHKYFVKPVSYMFSSRILRKALLKAIGDIEGKTVIDVSAGDDEIVLEIAKKADKVYANDIAIVSMEPLMRGIENIEFTEKNLLKIRKPRNKKYDVVICKNTLHHFYTPRQIEKALLKLQRLGKRVVIMDVEDPRKHWLSRLWNAYYAFLLKDQGGFFISFQQFKQALREVFGGDVESIRKVKTIKGTYMLAIIHSNDK